MSRSKISRTMRVALVAVVLSHGALAADIIPDSLVAFPTTPADGGKTVEVEPDALGRTPIHLAILRDPPAAIRALTELAAQGEDLNAPDGSGNTPLHLAVLVATPEVVRFLLTAGADPNRHGAGGASPLLRAVEAGRPQIVAALMAEGADATLRDDAGKSAQDLAAASADPAIRRAVASQTPGDTGSEAERIAHPLLRGERPGSTAIKAALVQLRKLGSEALPPFVTVLQDSAQPLPKRTLAAWILGRLGQIEAAPPLLATLREGNTKLSRDVATALCNLSPTPFAMDICRYIAEDDPLDDRVRWGLYEALATAKNPESLPFLMHAEATEVNPGCRERAADAVDAIMGGHVGPDRRAQMDWIRKNRPEWMRYFKEQVHLSRGYVNLALYFGAGTVLAGAAVWFLWTQF